MRVPKPTNFLDGVLLVELVADAIYKTGKLLPDTPLTGFFARDEKKADVKGLIKEIDEVVREEAARQRYKQSLEQ